ncbi:MAG: hypothetical protein AAFV29_27455, partial [Myxococcota bacterium]
MNPNFVLSIADTTYDFSASYTPRLFYRGFLEDTDIPPLERPLLAHGFGLSLGKAFSEDWRASITVDAQVGETDFQAAAAQVGPDDTPPTGVEGDPVGQTGNAQAISAMSLAGSIGVSGVLTRRLTWSNAVTASYIRPLGDSEAGADGAAAVAVQPESIDLGYNTTFGYRLARQHTLTIGAAYGFTLFEPLAAEGGGMMTAEAESQTVHSINLQLGYGWSFARNSNLSIAAGAQLALGQFGDPAMVGGTESNELLPLPTATIVLNWLPVNERSLTISNNLSAQVEGSVDRFIGTFQPRLTTTTGFQVAFPPRLTFDLTSSLSIPLTEAQNSP